jgi:hypothetical protein
VSLTRLFDQRKKVRKAQISTTNQPQSRLPLHTQNTQTQTQIQTIPVSTTGGPLILRLDLLPGAESPSSTTQLLHRISLDRAQIASTPPLYSSQPHCTKNPTSRIMASAFANPSSPVDLSTIPISPEGGNTNLSKSTPSGDEQITVFHDPDNFNVKHPLMHKWTLWFTKPPSGKACIPRTA